MRGPCPHFGGCLPSSSRCRTLRPRGEGPTLDRNEDATGDGQQPDPGRRTSWQAPRELRGPRPPQNPRADAQRDSRAPRPTQSEQDPRQATPRPRPSGTASTGQLPVARTRETTPGPTGTARIPIVRQNPAGPAAPRPRQREQVDPRQPEGQRPSSQQPVRSRLRTPPPAPPQQQPVAPRPTQPSSQLSPVRPATAPVTTRPFAQLALAPTPLPPTPTEFVHAPASTRQRRHGPKGFLAALAVLALGVLWGLPAFASESLDAPPVAGIAYDGVQHMQVGSDVDSGGAGADPVSGAMPVATAPSWIQPVDGHLGDPFGPRLAQPVPGVGLFHRGQDIVAPCGRQIRAAASGTVTAATYWGTYGNWILIDHGDGVAVGYAHESRMLVAVGQHVAAGQVIGLVGQTGAATGCHLHLEVHLNQVAVNPVPFFAARRISLS